MKKVSIFIIGLILLTSCQKPIQPEPTAIAPSPIPKETTPVTFKTGQTEEVKFESFLSSTQSNSGTVSFTIDGLKELQQINQTKASVGKKFILLLLTIKGNKDNKINTTGLNLDNFKTFWFYLTNGANGFSDKPIETDFLTKEYKATPYVNIKLTDSNPIKTFMVFELEQNFSIQQFVVKWRGKTNFDQKEINLI